MCRSNFDTNKARFKLAIHCFALLPCLDTLLLQSAALEQQNLFSRTVLASGETLE